MSRAVVLGCIVSAITLLCAERGRAPLLAAEAGSEVARYMPIPIIGHIDEVIPNGLSLCLRQASQNRTIKHIVFRIKSRGGNIEAVEKTMDLLKGHGDRFQYHALVEEAAGPAVCLVVCCDTIHMVEGSVVGGDVAEPGHEVSAALATRIGSMAQAKKHNFTLVRALLLREAQAHAWEDGAGKVHIDPLPPKGVSRDKMILQVGGSALLTLPRDYAMKVGFAKAGVEKAEGLGAAIGLSEWRETMGNYAAGVMNRLRINQKKEAEAKDAHLKQLEVNTQKRKALRQYIEQKQKEAIENDPGRFLYETDDPDDPITEPEMTGASRRRWRERTNECIAAWGCARDAALQLEQLEREALQLGGKRIMSTLALKTICDRATHEIERLEEQRTRCGP